MVHPFPLPTPSPLPLHTLLSSLTHPSLPPSASSARQYLRQTLKHHARMSPEKRAGHLPVVLGALEGYLPFLVAIWKSGRGEEKRVDVKVVEGGVQVQACWRPTLSSRGFIVTERLKHRRKGGRVCGTGLGFELSFVLSTLGYVLSNMARVRCLQTVYCVRTPTVEEKTAAISAGMKNLLRAAGVHKFLSENASVLLDESTTMTKTIPDLDASTQAALMNLAMAEATLLAVLKDDAYLSACIQARNPHDKDWMVKSPEIPKVRALLFARLCVRAAEYAEQAAAAVAAAMNADEELSGYMRVLGRVARAKACRFFGIDAEMDGRTGEGIAWLRAARGALGVKVELEGDAGEKERGKLGFSRLKREWSERREERRVEKDAGGKAGEREAELDWGDDAGREEEARVLDMLEEKWTKMNDTVNTQAIPSSASYLSNLPSGRDIHSPPAAYVLPKLDEDQLIRMRAVPEGEPVVDESSEEEPEPASSNYF